MRDRRDVLIHTADGVVWYGHDMFMDVLSDDGHIMRKVAADVSITDTVRVEVTSPYHDGCTHVLGVRDQANWRENFRKLNGRGVAPIQVTEPVPYVPATIKAHPRAATAWIHVRPAEVGWTIPAPTPCKDASSASRELVHVLMFEFDEARLTGSAVMLDAAHVEQAVVEVRRVLSRRGFMVSIDR